MIGVVGGLITAVLWGTSSVAAARASRLVGADVALAWAYVTGLLAVLPVAAATGLPSFDAGTAAWTALAAVTAVSSLFLLYAALQRGPVVLVAPITASQGGVAALVAVALGERLGMLAGVGLFIVMLGMYAVMRRPRGVVAAPHPTTAVVLAGVCAAIAGVALYSSAQAGESLGAAWLLTILRTAGVLGLSIPLVVSRRLRAPRPASRLVVFCGLADTVAYASYVVAATESGVAVPAVIGSQFAAVSVLIGMTAMGERLTRLQLGGIVGILAGVAVVTGSQA
jgi:drug/metabolite transporter (DMT)-like permease